MLLDEWDVYNFLDEKRIRSCEGDRSCWKFASISKCLPHPRNAAQKTVSELGEIWNLWRPRRSVFQVTRLLDHLFWGMGWELAHVAVRPVRRRWYWWDCYRYQEREERELRSAKLLLHVMVDPFVREMFTADLAACRGSDISPVILLFCRSEAKTPSQ